MQKKKMRKSEISSSDGFAEDIEDFLNDDTSSLYESSKGISTTVLINATGIAAAMAAIITIFFTESVLLSAVVPITLILAATALLDNTPFIIPVIPPPNIPPSPREPPSFREDINKTINRYKTKLKDFFDSILKKMGDWLKEIGRLTRSIYEAIGKPIMDMLIEWKDRFMKNKYVEIFRNAFDTVTQALKDAAKTIVDSFKNTWDSVKGIANNLVQGLKDSIKAGWADLINEYKMLLDNINKSFAGRMVRNLKEKVSIRFKPFIDKITKFRQDISDFVTGEIIEIKLEFKRLRIRRAMIEIQKAKNDRAAIRAKEYRARYVVKDVVEADRLKKLADIQTERIKSISKIVADEKALVRTIDMTEVMFAATRSSRAAAKFNSLMEKVGKIGVVAFSIEGAIGLESAKTEEERTAVEARMAQETTAMILGAAGGVGIRGLVAGEGTVGILAEVTGGIAAVVIMAGLVAIDNWIDRKFGFSVKRSFGNAISHWKTLPGLGYLVTIVESFIIAVVTGDRKSVV